MGIDIDVSVSGDWKKKLDRLERNVKSLTGTHSIKMSEIVTPQFLRKHTRFENIEALLVTGGFLTEGEVLTQEKYRSIPDESLDDFISKETKFPDWKSLLNAAVEEYAQHRLMDGL